MTKSTNGPRIAEAAVAWTLLRRVAARLLLQRGRLSCDQHDNDKIVSGGPCWKPVQTVYDDDGDGAAHVLYRDQDEWCAECLERQDTHMALKLVRRLRGIAMRRLEAMARGTGERDDIVPARKDVTR